MLRARRTVWHKQHRGEDEAPHTSIDTEAYRTTSGWRCWAYKWKLHLVTIAVEAWLPLAAELTAANVGDNEVAPRLLTKLPAEVRFVLGNHQYGAPNIRAHYD